MKRSLLVFLVFLTSFVTAFSQSKDGDADAKQKVIQADEDCNDAVLAGNTKEINNLFADNFKDYFENQEVNKDSILKAYNKPTTGVTEKNIKINATIYGNAAIAHGVREEKYAGYNPSYILFTDMFVQKKNRWQIVASQENVIPVWEVRNLEDSEFEVIAYINCDTESSLKSLNYNVPTFLRIKNTTSSIITVYWINDSGRRDTSADQIRQIAPGKSLNIRTYFTHPFIVIDANGRCKGIYETTTNPSMAIIKD